MRPPPRLSQLPYFPVTGGIVLLSIVTTAARWMDHDTSIIEMNYLAFHGQPWRLLTSAFPHVGFFHLVFNAYWIWALGSVVEKHYGHLRTAAFYALLAAGSSAAEYGFAIGGVGLSGVGYGIFGFLWVLGRTDPKFKDVIDRATAQLFVFWFFLCIVLTLTNIMPVANYAHGFGAILGALVGWIISPSNADGRKPARIPAALGMVFLLASIFWAATIGRPIVNFSKDGSDDIEKLGYEALMRDDNQNAAHLFEIATSMRHPDSTAWLNLGVAYQRLGREDEAEAAFTKAAKAGAIDGAGHPVRSRS